MFKRASSIIAALVMMAFILSPFQAAGAVTRGAVRATEPPPPDQPVRPGGPGVKTEPMAKLDNELRSLAAKGGAEPVVVYIYAEEDADLSKVVEVQERRPLAFGGELVVAKVLPNKIAKMASSSQVKAAEAWHAIQAPVPLTPKEDVERLTREQVKELHQKVREGTALSLDALKRQFPSGAKAPGKPNSPASPEDWVGVDVIHAREAWANGYDGDKVNIAIIDSGVDFGHPDLEFNWAYYDEEGSPYDHWPIALDPRSMREYYYNGATSSTNYNDWWDYSWYADVYNVLHCTGGEEASFDFAYDPGYGEYDPIVGTWTIASEITQLSRSGEIRWGIHPDEQLYDFIGFGWVPFILVDTMEAGKYDMVIADLNHDFWFDEFDDTATLGSPDPVLNQDLGSYLYDDTEVMTGTQYVGLGWWPMDSSTGNNLNSVWGSASNDVFAVGSDGTILHFNGDSWSDMSFTTSEALNGVWGSAYNDVWAVGTAPPSGSFTRLRYNGEVWTAYGGASAPPDIYGVWGSASNNVWAVGESGVVRRWNGSNWLPPSNYNSGTSNDLYGVWGSASNDVYAVGANGTIRHYSSGSSWTGITSGTTNNLYGVWGSAANDVFVVGASGTISHTTDGGATWSNMTSGTSEDLRSVWGNASDDVFAVGVSGTILHYDGVDWSDMDSGTDERLNGVWGSDSEDMFAVGANGTILHFYDPLGLVLPPTWFYPPLQAAETITLTAGTWVLAWDHNSLSYIEDEDPDKRAYNGADGTADVSGGMVYFIADGELPVPGMDYLYPGHGPGGLPAIPFNGQLVTFMIGSYWAGGGEHGTLCASAAVAEGNATGYFAATGEWGQYEYEDWSNFPYGDGSGPGSIMPWWKDADTGTVQGPAPMAGVIAIGDSYQVVNDMQGMYDAYTFLAYGVDGEPETGDEYVDVVSMSYGDGTVHNDGWDWESRLLSYYNQEYLPNTTFVASAGNGGHGYGTVSSPGGNTLLTVGASTLYGQDTAFGSGMEVSQLNDGEVQPFSSRGPDATGAPEPDVLATGAWGAGDVPLNLAPGYAAGANVYVGDGNNAWYSWGGTSRAAPEAAGVMALVYEAYRQAHGGASPDFETAQQILMSGADDLSHDVLMQGAGRVNADRATDLASGSEGVYVQPSKLAAGEYQGEQHEAFANVLFPGDDWTQTFTVVNPSGSAVDVQIGDEVLLEYGSPVEYSVVVKPDQGLEDDHYPMNYYYYADYFVGANPALEEHGEDLVIHPPYGADLMQVELIVPMELFDFVCGDWNLDPPYNCLWWKTYNDPNPDSVTYEQNQRWSLTVYDWSDLDDNGWLWKDTNMDGVVNPIDTSDELQVSDIPPYSEWQTEINRFAYSYLYGNHQEVTVRLGDRDDIDNIVIGIAHKYPNDARPGWGPEDYLAHPLQIKVTYYQKADWGGMVSETPTALSVPAGDSSTFDAVFEIPSDMYPGLYEGAIAVYDETNDHLTLIPTTINVAVPSEELLFELGRDGDWFTSPYQNYHMDGGWTWYDVYEQGDWRFFYYDADAGFDQQYLYVRNQWGEPCGNMPTFNETLVWGPNYHDQFSLVEPEKYGPYGMQYAGGTPFADYFDYWEWPDWGFPRMGYWWNTSEGPQPESRAWATLWDGLNMVQFRNILLSGKQSCGEGYQATAGVFGVDAPQSGLVINTTTESGSFTVNAVSPVEGLGAYAGGFDTYQYFRNQTVPQGKHPDERWPADLMSGWKYDFSTVNVYEIGLQVQGPGTSDVAVALMYDANGDGLFNMYDNKEALVYLDANGGGGEDLWYDKGEGIPFVADGRYRLVVYGNRITPGDQYNMKLTLRGGNSLSIEGSEPENFYILDTDAGESVELTVDYTVPGPGIWSGGLWFWMPPDENRENGSQGEIIFVPVFINKEGALVSVEKDVSQEMVKWGDVLTYTIHILNAGATEIGTELTDMLPVGLAMLPESLGSELQVSYPQFWSDRGCEMGYDEWMRTIHYNCALGGAYPEDTITFRARVVAQPGTEFLNKADLKWYWGDWPGMPYSFEYDTAFSYIPKANIYLPVILKP